MSLQRILVVGGGPAGMVAAIALAREGMAVDLVEIADSFTTTGIGVNLQNSPLRALHALGVLDEVAGRGASTSVINLCNAQGVAFAPPITPPPMVPGYPASVGIDRGVLSGILARALGAETVRTTFGTTVTAIRQHDDRVGVTFSDGRNAEYDLLIGADGIHSQVRKLMLGADEPPLLYCGQCIWRAGAPRGDLEEYQMLHAPGAKLGLVPIAKDRIYVYVLRGFPVPPEREALGDAQAAFREAVAGFGGPAAGIADRIDTPIDFRALRSVIVDDPWHHGRVLLVGDAAHATTPHISYGLGTAVEDGLVLGELARHFRDDIPALLAAFMRRRFDRCSIVVANSRQLAEWEVHPPADRGAHTRLMRESVMRLSEPF